MASRAILRRRNPILDQINSSIRTSSYIPSISHEFSTEKPTKNPNINTKENSTFLARIAKENLLGFHKKGTIFTNPYGTIGTKNSIIPLGARFLIQPVRTASTATQSETSEESNEEQKSKQVKKEASPEECDQAVEGLSTVKAKAKAKVQLQEVQKPVQSLVQKFWATLLGIGPALKAIASMSRADWAVKIEHWKEEFVSTLKHYWLGSKLLWADVRISSRLLLKLASGKVLSRRERQQLTRTITDIIRLVPFAFFVIIPFMEFLLPVFLKLFPNMLPSTFQDKMKEEEEMKKKLKAKIRYAAFLQETSREMIKELQNLRKGELTQTAEDLDEFLEKVRKGGRVTNDEIMSFAKLFNDELTLDNMSRPRLVNMCKYMGIQPFGTDNYLRFMLRRKLQEIKNDDKLIQAEGVDSLTEEELRQACRERGALGLLSVEEMRNQLRDWLDLSLNRSVPSSLLILSRAFTVSGKLKPEEAVVATISSLPDEVVDTVGTVLPSEDSVSERKRKLEFLEMQEELIKEEEKKKGKEKEGGEEGEAAEEEDIALKEMVGPTVRERVQLAKKAKKLSKQEPLGELSQALAVLASASSVSKERQEFLGLVNKEIELYNEAREKEGTDGEEEAKKAYKAAIEGSDRAAEVAARDKVSAALMEKVDAMLHKLEKEIDDVDAKIGNRWQLLDIDRDGKVTPEEVAAAATYLKDTIGKDGVQELISSLSTDKDGKILVEDIVKLASEIDEPNKDEATQIK